MSAPRLVPTVSDPWNGVGCASYEDANSDIFWAFFGGPDKAPSEGKGMHVVRFRVGTKPKEVLTVVPSARGQLSIDDTTRALILTWWHYDEDVAERTIVPEYVRVTSARPAPSPIPTPAPVFDPTPLRADMAKLLKRTVQLEEASAAMASEQAALRSALPQRIKDQLFNMADLADAFYSLLLNSPQHNAGVIGAIRRIIDLR